MVQATQMTDFSAAIFTHLMLIISVWFPNFDLQELTDPSPVKVWIDTDTACTGQPRKDPDDCLAVFALARAPHIKILGLSSVFGNANLATTHKTLLQLTEMLETEGNVLPLPTQGARHATSHYRQSVTNDASESLCGSLGYHRLTVVALGPLTNIAHTIRTCPNRIKNIERIVIVGGRRPGHVFHPMEDAATLPLFKHTILFRDLNISLDTRAAKQVVDSGLPITLTPYELARQFELTSHDLEALSGMGPTGAWIADKSRPWLEYWRNTIGRQGFYPFDLFAAAAVIAPNLLECTPLESKVARDTRGRWFGGPTSLLFFPETESRKPKDTITVEACLSLSADAPGKLRNLIVEAAHND